VVHISCHFSSIYFVTFTLTSASSEETSCSTVVAFIALFARRSDDNDDDDVYENEITNDKCDHYIVICRHMLVIIIFWRTQVYCHFVAF